MFNWGGGLPSISLPLCTPLSICMYSILSSPFKTHAIVSENITSIISRSTILRLLKQMPCNYQGLLVDLYQMAHACEGINSMVEYEYEFQVFFGIRYFYMEIAFATYIVDNLLFELKLSSTN